jgi:hypothetical protein
VCTGLIRNFKGKRLVVAREDINTPGALCGLDMV